MTSDLMLTLMSCLVLGLTVGALAGVLGAGGSIFTIPIFVYLYGEPVHEATSAALLIGLVIAGAAVLARVGRGTVLLRPALLFAVPAALLSYPGTALNRVASPDLILALLGAVMGLVAYQVWRISPRPLQRRGWSVTVLTITVGMGCGILLGFFGVGGGFLLVPALMIVLGFTVDVAIGTSLLIVVLVSAAALPAHLATTHLSLRTTLPFALGGFVGAVVGTRLAKNVSNEVVSRSFAVLVAAVGALLLIRTMPLVASGLVSSVLSAAFVVGSLATRGVVAMRSGLIPLPRVP